MHKILLSAFVLLGLLLLTTPYSCYYDNEEDLYGPATCDTSGVRYSVEIRAIIQSRCISCHGGDAALGGGIPLNTYDEVYLQAATEQIVSSVSRNTDWMPKGESRLPDCSINQIRAWVAAGAPE